MNFVGDFHVLNGLWPTATRWNTGSPATSTAVNLGKYGHATFIIQEGAGGAGTATFTVVACTDTGGTSPTAIPFHYRLCDTQDIWGAYTACAATGYLSIAGANKLIAIEVDATELTAAKPYVAIVATVGVATAVAAGCIIILSEASYPQGIPLTAIA